MIKGNKFIHFENLDALRAIAAFTVILYHISFWFEYPTEKKYNWLKFTISFGGNGGSYGVIFFFILSGFLITYLMLEEQTLQGRINIFYFYVRRILKIWPLYYLTILIGFIIYPIISLLMGHRYTENANFLLYIIFATNFDHIYNGNPSIGILGVQWSVAVEEQFYLLWPIVFYFLSKKYFFPFIVIALIITSELFFINSVNWAISYYHFFSCLRFLAFGSLIAYLSYFKKNWIDLFLSKINKATTFSIYFTCLTLLLFEQKLYGTFLFCKYFYHILPYMFFGFIIIEQNFSNNSVLKIGSFRILNWLGKISYGLYLTHMIAIYIVIETFPAGPNFLILKISTSILLTVVISYFCYNYIEVFFLSYKNKFSRIKLPIKV